MISIRNFAFAALASLPLTFIACGDLGTNPGSRASGGSVREEGYDPTTGMKVTDRGPISEAPSSPIFESAPAGSTPIGNASALPLGAAGAVFRSDFEDQDAGCWGNRQASGYATAACGDWTSIGTGGARLAVGEASHSGGKSMAVTFTKNEDVAGASLPVNADVVNVRAYYNFAPGFDFGQGIKIGRVSSFNAATQANDIDMVLEVRSAGSQCGLSDMADVGLYFNGKPVGYDWGDIASGISFQRGRWYAVEYQVALNTPGAADGSVKLWVDGVLVASKAGINIRGTGGATTKLNRLRVGGWYSNGAHGNGCADPSQASTMYVDDVAVGKDYIGMD